MHGPSHYRKAEELLAECDRVERGCVGERSMLAEAQVHATLALAAAAALAGSPNMLHWDDEDWHRAASGAPLRDAAEKAS